jgi:hypothetical protein
MIDYDYLCQAIDDWREGKRPAAPMPATGTPPVGTPGGYDEVDSGLVVMDEGESYDAPVDDQPQQEYAEQGYADPGHEEQGYAEQGYEQQAYEEQGYEQQEYAEQGEAQGYAAEAGAEQVEQVDRTQAYVPEEYDPAGVAEQQAEAADDESLDVDVEEEEDFERDYDLEAQDDFAGFDPYSDLAGWFVAQKKVEAAWEDPSSRNALFAEHGVRDRQHFYQVQATFERYFQSEDAAERYGGLDSIMQLQMNAIQDQMMNQMQERAEGELASEFEPVEGIGLEEWAQCQAHVASGGSIEEVCEALGVDQAQWDRISAEWNARMSRDTTATIATAYGKAFSGAGAGQYGDAGQDAAQAMQAGGDVEGEAPIPFERFVEIEQAQAAASERGEDVSAVLESYGMSPMDWGTVGGWWSQYIARHAMENNQELFHRYTELQQQYAAQFGVGQDTDDDVDY